MVSILVFGPEIPLTAELPSKTWLWTSIKGYEVVEFSKCPACAERKES
jgi:hypothetical protein